MWPKLKSKASASSGILWWVRTEKCFDRKLHRGRRARIVAAPAKQLAAMIFNDSRRQTDADVSRAQREAVVGNAQAHVVFFRPRFDVNGAIPAARKYNRLF